MRNDLVNNVFQATRKYDRIITITTLVLILIGLVSINSATLEAAEQLRNFERQVIWLVIGILLMVIVLAIPIRFYYMLAYIIYGLSILFLLALFFVGHGSGVQRWISLGLFSVQPSEFAKLGLIFALAKYLSDTQNHHPSLFRTKIVTTMLFLLPFLLVARQPDLGTAMILWSIFLPILYWAGLRLYTVFLILAPLFTFIASFNFYTFFLVMVLITAVFYFSRHGLKVFLFNIILNILVGILSPIIWGSLKLYQKQRILAFIGLVNDPQGAGYQIIQSKVAIGSGGLFGKGLLKGSQTHLRFLPEQHTDFIFSVIAEELGFLGVIVVLSLFAILLSRGLKIAFSAKSNFEALLVIGITCSLAFQIFINIGMTAGIMPVTGLPLPLISYGGSSLISVLIMVGIILSVAKRRFE